MIPPALLLFLALTITVYVLAGGIVLRWFLRRWCWRDLPRFDGTGVRELNGDCVPVQVRGETVWIAGVAADSEARAKAALGNVPPAGLTVFLAHSPDTISVIAHENVDLCCCGHMHGGQIALPLYGALIALTRTGKAFEAGLYRVGQTWLYINRGLGMEGGSLPRMRFCACPELTLIDLAPGPSAP